MRVVIDIQGMQSESKYRGIGRYCLGFIKSIIKNSGKSEVILVANSLLINDIDCLYEEFLGILPKNNIRVFNIPGRVRACDPTNRKNGRYAEIIREDFLRTLQPDIVHICSLFEGYIDDAITSIGIQDNEIPVTVSIYDLIPLLYKNEYFSEELNYKEFYLRKIKFMEKAACCLTISKSTTKEVLQNTNIKSDRVINVGTGIETCVTSIPKNIAREFLRNKFQIDNDFILYSGGSDKRKNLKRLIEAFSHIGGNLQQRYVLVIVGRMLESNVNDLFEFAKKINIKQESLFILGYVSDEELIHLYSATSLYVLPSWHEGFGFPILEAMLHGAPVICSNASSMPEVHGLEGALFDPFESTSISKKIQEVLTSEKITQQLVDHAAIQVKKFSWDSVAQKVWKIWHEIHERKINSKNELNIDNNIFKLIKKLPEVDDKRLKKVSVAIGQNFGNGILRQIFIDISELSQRDSGTGVQRVVKGYLRGLIKNPPLGYSIRPVYATVDGEYRYANKFYAKFFSGLDCEGFQDELIIWQRGDIFFCLDMQHHVQLSHVNFYKKLMDDGVTVKFLIYDLLPIELNEYFSDSNHKFLHESLMRLISTTDGAICISEATKNAYLRWMSENCMHTKRSFCLDAIHIGADIESTQLAYDFKNISPSQNSRLTFLVVSTLEPRKMHQQVIGAFEILWKQGIDVNLIFVGGSGWGSEKLLRKIQEHQALGKRLFWLDSIPDESLVATYKSADCLIIASLNEGFGLPIIEAAKYSLPVIARDIPVFREIGGCNLHYFNGMDDASLARSINEWIELKNNCKAPDIRKIAFNTWKKSTELLKNNLVGNNKLNQIFVDLSEIVQKDVGSGVQRVVRNILRELLKSEIKGFKVEPVYALNSGGYKYARKYTNSFLGKEVYSSDDRPIEFKAGDIFFGLDMNLQVVDENQAFYRLLRKNGVTVKFMLHDLLPIQFPQFFHPGTDLAFKKWLTCILNSDGVICVSQTVRDQLKVYQKENDLQNRCDIVYSHNGFELDQKEVSDDIVNNSRELIKKAINQNSCFLMVGTIEPRKAHLEVIETFERLWLKNIQVTLIIVGKLGWLSERTEKLIKNSSHLNKNLYWFSDINDSELELMYKKSACLIAASYGEGFGLPLIEAAHYDLPIIARDIQIFREIAENNILYFDSTKMPLELAVLRWLMLKNKKCEPRSGLIKSTSWADSVERLIQLLIKSK
jgi:glycosyltransferase involved in cell wall biosynthesis